MTQKQRATFRSMTEGTQEDYAAIATSMMGHITDLPDRIMDHMRLLSGDYGGFNIDRLEHCLQSATRAYRDGKDEEYVVCALLHDIGDTLGPANHADVAAVLLEPFVSEKNHWIIKHHGIFQGYYFFHHLGMDRNMRDQYKDHPYYQACAEFCHRYDQNCFDENYESEPLEFFEPMIRNVFASVKKSLYAEATEQQAAS
ncbi:MAG: HD domain-containing protein [Candidatus Pelagadaptatus aseana]|uniref:HD domain-containing protein n=1 Tax=Candidatus Pelagadaptatus aseana TaxID=3120508 RepID=UPI0039B2FE4E